MKFVARDIGQQDEVDHLISSFAARAPVYDFATSLVSDVQHIQYIANRADYNRRLYKAKRNRLGEVRSFPIQNGYSVHFLQMSRTNKAIVITNDQDNLLSVTPTNHSFSLKMFDAVTFYGPQTAYLLYGVSMARIITADYTENRLIASPTSRVYRLYRPNFYAFFSNTSKKTP